MCARVSVCLHTFVHIAALTVASGGKRKRARCQKSAVNTFWRLVSVFGMSTYQDLQQLQADFEESAVFLNKWRGGEISPELSMSCCLLSSEQMGSLKSTQLSQEHSNHSSQKVNNDKMTDSTEVSYITNVKALFDTKS